MFENANKAAIDLLISEGVKFEEMENLIFIRGKNMKTVRKPNSESETKKKKKKKTKTKQIKKYKYIYD